MLRVKDALKSIQFYRDFFSMILVSERHFANFSLYFLASIPVELLDDIETTRALCDPTSEEAHAFVKSKLYSTGIPVLELTHNHGTEKMEDFRYANGNEESKLGFGHIGFLVNDVDAFRPPLEKTGVVCCEKPGEGLVKEAVFAVDPDGYWVEIMQHADLSK
jgi:lactoylglutathione lyase